MTHRDRGDHRNTHYPGKWIVSFRVRTDHPVQPLLYLSISKRYQLSSTDPPDLDGNPDTRVTGHPSPVTLVPGHFFYFFWRELIFFRKKMEKNVFALCFFSLSLSFSLFLSLFLSFYVHVVWVLFSLINFTKVTCEG